MKSALSRKRAGRFGTFAAATSAIMGLMLGGLSALPATALPVDAGIQSAATAVPTPFVGEVTPAAAGDGCGYGTEGPYADALCWINFAGAAVSSGRCNTTITLPAAACSTDQPASPTLT